MAKDRFKFYCTLYCQAFSPCGKYFAVADCYGRITLYKLSSVLSAKKPGEDEKAFFYQFQAEKGAIYTLHSTDAFLICGGVEGRIKGFLWSELCAKVGKAAWVIEGSTASGLCNDGSAYEINGLAVGQNGDTLFSGGGDGKVHQWSLENGVPLRSYKGHTDYIHCLCAVGPSDQKLVLSGSEDGSIRAWDSRTSTCQHVMEPYKQKDIVRPKLGNFVGTIAADNDWMICGGGVDLSIWHLGSWSYVKGLTTGQNTPHYSACLYEDKIFTAGDNKNLLHWNFKGDLIADIPATVAPIYDISVNTKNEKYKILCACGQDSKLDVFINPSYRAFSLSTF